MKEGRHPIQVSPDDTSSMPTWIRDAARQVRLAWRLFWDRRVPLWTKLIPPAAVSYILFPFDILTDFAPGLGQMDDIAVLLIGVKLFIELAPPDVVREHLLALGARIQEWRVEEEGEEEAGGPAVIEGEYRLGEPEKRELAGD